MTHKSDLETQDIMITMSQIQPQHCNNMKAKVGLARKKGNYLNLGESVRCDI